MQVNSALVTLKGMTPYSQSRKHETPRLEGESHEDYDRRTWRERQTVEVVEGKRSVVVPAFALHCAISDAAKYSGGKIKGEGMKRWTEKFRSGLMFRCNPSLDLDPDDTDHIDVWVNADGRRGGSVRVWRRFPIFWKWTVSFELMVLDPIITEAKLVETLSAAGLFIGIGRYRPQNMGTNGRFTIESLDWRENRGVTP